MKNGHLLNWSATTKFILNRAEVVRPGHTFTQVRKRTLEGLEYHLRNYIDNLLRSHPSVGKSVDPFPNQKKDK